MRESARLPSAIVLRVELRQASSWPERRLTVADAVEVASKPFRVFLENGGSDRGFLLALFRPEDRQWIERRADKEWLEFEGWGGTGELHKRVKWALKHDSRMIRSAALFDGDAVELPATDPEG
ncbi:MAG: hypothetical protein KAI47_08745, partial [Deltaproteobacteria bacterium]|nr:hypothetical protein [Deltaproteobacteria bacterium]